jgi:ABC-type transport system involved in multi-copper enzyme maturation permease subunit/ABC-type uncharacterized transport system involved in gliding motility auxiliary subunit
VGAVFGRNFLSYFSNPAGYVFITLFVLVCSWFAFWQPRFFTNNLANLDPLNQWMPYILLFFIPAITMSIWAEERRQGTDELLLTLPARDFEVVLGKFLAALGIYTVSLAFLALGHVPVLRYLGNPDFGVLASTYLGYWLMGALLIAVGMVASILTSSVTVGFILGALFCALPVFAGTLGPFGQMLHSITRVPGLGWLAPVLGQGGGAIARQLEDLSVPSQFRDFGRGVIPLASVFYFVGLAAAMLFLNMVLLGRRHWAGGERSRGRWTHALIRVVSVIVALISLDMIIGRWLNHRVDATEERVHTLSSVSREVVKQIPADRPVFIEAFVSPEVPREYVEVRTNLINTLDQLAAMGGNRILLNLVETDRFSPQARDAEERFGITARRVPVLRDGRQSVEEIFLGVAFRSGLEQIVIPFFDRGLPVEYELTRSIRVVSGSKRKRVGILDTDAKLLGRVNFNTMSPDPEWAIASELKKQYDVASVTADTPIPVEEVQTISVAGQPTSGSFTLSFEGEATTSLPHNAEAKAVAEALEKLPTIGPGNVRVEGGPLPKDPLRITFTGRFLARDVPELALSSDIKAGEKDRPTMSVGTTTQVLDALVVAQASSMTQPQIDNLRDYIRQGGPTLILVDPFPVTNFTLAPAEPRMPENPMMGQRGEPKGSLRELFEMIGIDWPSEQIVWNPYNPHPQIEMPLEYVFIGRGRSFDGFGADPVTTRLQEVFLPFPGLLRSREMPGDPEFTPLLQTDRLGGTLTYDDALERGPLGLSRIREPRPHFPTNREYTLAARIQGKPRDTSSAPETAKPPSVPARDVHVIVIADLDLISDFFFSFRRQPVDDLETLDFDNVTFALNCVDVLAGDQTFLELRKKRPAFRTLARLEAESKRFIDQSQAEQRKAEQEAEAQLEEARKRLNTAVDEIRKSNEYDERTKESMVRYREQVEQRRLTLKEAEIEAQKDQAISQSLASRAQAIAALQNQARMLAMLWPPLPAFVLGAIVFLVRRGRENRGANPERLV